MSNSIIHIHMDKMALWLPKYWHHVWEWILLLSWWVEEIVVFVAIHICIELAQQNTPSVVMRPGYSGITLF